MTYDRDGRLRVLEADRHRPAARQLGFKGYVNSDTGIINDRAWGLESKTRPGARRGGDQRAASTSCPASTTKQTIVDLVKGGLVAEARVERGRHAPAEASSSRSACSRTPYVDASKATAVIGASASAPGLEVIQKKSIVLLENSANGDGAAGRAAGKKVYTIGMGKADVERYGFTVTDGNDSSTVPRPSAAGNDVAIIRVLVRDANASYASTDPLHRRQPDRLNPLTGKTWGSEDPCVMFPDVNPPNPPRPCGFCLCGRSWYQQCPALRRRAAVGHRRHQLLRHGHADPVAHDVSDAG